MSYLEIHRHSKNLNIKSARYLDGFGRNYIIALWVFLPRQIDPESSRLI